MGTRKFVDCRDMPELNCSLKISGTEEEVLKAAVEHKISSHGESETPHLRENIKKMLKDDVEMDYQQDKSPYVDHPTEHRI